MTVTDKTADSYRLPVSAAPLRYELLLAPDLEQALFTGRERIELTIAESTDRIVMNAVHLEIKNATLHKTSTSASPTQPASKSIPLSIEFDPINERVAFLAGHQLEPGGYLFECEFNGILNDKLCGFYRSSFTDDHGVEQVIATTQFEATDARRAFPCFDEPDRKAVFSITLDAPAGMLAISNGPEIEAEDLDDGGRRIRFDDTIAMSTYLVCFVVGPLEATEPVDVDGVALRVVHLPGKEHLTSPAIEIATHALAFFTNYFAIPYPSNKLDLVAIPDFAAGAMENLGCVTFREAILLADPANVSQVEMERLAEVVEHELAHMWFGDLVTMRWWNGIWLNEAFATYMSLLCQDDYRPEWQCFVSFARGKAQALNIDALHATRPIEFPVRHPDESSAMFDVLTYEKGASVLWMIDAFLGGTHFRDGVRAYLRAHEYANTDTTDLWDAIEAEAGDIPIRSVMDSWIYQGGYPLISATQDAGSGAIEIRQSSFAYLAPEENELGESAIGTNWLVPMLFSPIDKPASRERLLLDKKPVQLDAAGTTRIFNAGGAGFFRLHYDSALTASILGLFGQLGALERYNLCSDTWATILAGKAELDEFFEIVAHLDAERDPHVWSTIIGALSLIDLTASPKNRPALSRYVTAVLAPQLDQVRWQRKENEDDQTPVLRAALVAALGTIAEHVSTIEMARELFVRDHSTGESIDADLAGSVMGVVAAHATREEFDTIVDRYRNPRSPMDQIRHLNCLASLRDLNFAGEVHEMCLSEVRSQNSPFLIGGMLHNRYVGAATWKFVAERFDDLVKRLPEVSLHRMLEGVVGLCELDDHGESRHLADVRSFLLARIEGGKRRLILQSIERLQINVAFGRRLQTALGPLLDRVGVGESST